MCVGGKGMARHVTIGCRAGGRARQAAAACMVVVSRTHACLSLSLSDNNSMRALMTK